MDTFDMFAAEFLKIILNPISLTVPYFWCTMIFNQFPYFGHSVTKCPFLHIQPMKTLISLQICAG